jgi:hypothetical protein
MRDEFFFERGGFWIEGQLGFDQGILTKTPGKLFLSPNPSPPTHQLN